MRVQRAYPGASRGCRPILWSWRDSAYDLQLAATPLSTCGPWIPSSSAAKDVVQLGCCSICALSSPLPCFAVRLWVRQGENTSNDFLFGFGRRSSRRICQWEVEVWRGAISGNAQIQTRPELPSPGPSVLEGECLCGTGSAARLLGPRI